MLFLIKLKRPEFFSNEIIYYSHQQHFLFTFISLLLLSVDITILSIKEIKKVNILKFLIYFNKKNFFIY